MGNGNETVSIGTWVVVLILIAIPIVGFITILVLAFTENESLKNFARASLVLMGVGIALSLLLVACSGF